MAHSADIDPAVSSHPAPASSSIAALAEWVQSLPLESLAPVGVLFIAGMLLLLFGQRLLKPVLVIASVFAGVVIAVRIGNAMQSGLSPLLWSAFGAIAGVLFVSLSYRVVLGVAVGSIGAVVAMLLATTAAELGWIDVGPQPSSSSTLRAEESSPSRPNVRDPLVAAAMILAQDSPVVEARDAVASKLDEVSPGLGPKFVGWIDRLNGLLATSGDWIHERWELMPKPMRTLLLASAAAGAFLGFVAGLASPTWAAATITSLFGGLLVLGCGVPLASRVVPPDSMPEIKPLGWLVLWLVISAAGWAFQWWSRPQTSSKKSQKKSKDDDGNDG